MTSVTKGLHMEVEGSPGIHTGEQRDHQMAIRVGRQTKAAEIVLHKTVPQLQDSPPPELKTSGCHFLPAPPLRAEEIRRTGSAAEDELPTLTLLKELPMPLLLIASGPDHGSAATRRRNISQHQIRPGRSSTNSTAQGRQPARSRQPASRRDKHLNLLLFGLIFTSLVPAPLLSTFRPATPPRRPSDRPGLPGTTLKGGRRGRSSREEKSEQKLSPRAQPSSDAEVCASDLGRIALLPQNLPAGHSSSETWRQFLPAREASGGGGAQEKNLTP